MRSLIINRIWLPALLLVMGCSRQNGRLPSETIELKETTQNTLGEAVITFDRLTHDFGTIIEGEKVVCYFDYENTGTVELMIHSVDATCGCTTPDWNREPVMPGDRKSLKIIFDATGRSGAQRKVVTVMSNASNQVVKLTLKANIET